MNTPKTPRPWPKFGDSLFSQSGDTSNDAPLKFDRNPWDPPNPWDLYARGYLEAAGHLSARAIEAGREFDTSIYPIVFLYRHYLELRLKELIVQGSALTEVPSNLKLNHHIDELWRSVRKILEKIWPNEPGTELEAVELCIGELCAVDKKSDEFRYPFRRDGGQTLPELKHLNLRHFREVMDGIAAFLESCSTGISVYSDELRSSRDYR